MQVKGRILCLRVLVLVASGRKVPLITTAFAIIVCAYSVTDKAWPEGVTT